MLFLCIYKNILEAVSATDINCMFSEKLVSIVYGGSSTRTMFSKNEMLSLTENNTESIQQVEFIELSIAYIAYFISFFFNVIFNLILFVLVTCSCTCSRHIIDRLINFNLHAYLPQLTF